MPTMAMFSVDFYKAFKYFKILSAVDKYEQGYPAATSHRLKYSEQ